MAKYMKQTHGLWLGLALALFAGGVAQAIPPPEECDEWFPDFQCEDRQGRYEGFVMPMQMPFIFEDPFITSGFNAVAVWHDYPKGSAMGGGEMWVLALQARLAITDRLAFIATKDGYAFNRPNNPILPDDNGFFDITAGFKYALIDMPEKNFILTPSFRIEVPVGQKRVYSGNGSGIGIPAVAAAWGIGDFHVIGDVGAQLPFDWSKQVSQVFWNLHLDYGLLSWLVPFFEVGGLHYTSSGDGSFPVHTVGGNIALGTAQTALGTGPFDGVDVANLGSQSMAGKDIVIGTFGIRFPIDRHWSLGGSYDMPFTKRKDIFEQRVTMMVTYDF